jgi:predicted Rossmann fold nucleotide-binding protein DprA/Smf involved in DNA uptake
MEISIMTAVLNADTQAVLMLCSSLGQRGNGGAKPLSPAQYSALVRWLLERSMRPADLLTVKGRERLRELHLPEVSREMIEPLLDRGAALAIMVERWKSLGLWVLSRSDAAYPARYKQYLGQASPALLYGVGEPALMNAGGLAILGSRAAAEEDLEFSRRVAATCARQGVAVISGAAKGVDSEAMMASVDSGGRSVGVLAEGLARAAVASRYHDAIVDGRLSLISAYEPEARWFAYAAMERNKLVYGLGEAALVVASSTGEGGTWAGATEALRHGRITVYVKATGSLASGNAKLLKMGAKPFPPEPWEGIRGLIAQPAPAQGLLEFEPAPKASEAVTLTLQPPAPIAADPQAQALSEEPAPAPTDAYSLVLPALLGMLREPQHERSVADGLGVLPAQARAWLKRALEEGKVRKLKKPVRYVAGSQNDPLFAG